MHSFPLGAHTAHGLLKLLHVVTLLVPSSISTSSVGGGALKCLVCIQAVGAPVVLTYAFKAPAGWYVLLVTRRAATLATPCSLAASSPSIPFTNSQRPLATLSPLRDSTYGRSQRENEVATATCRRCQCFPHVVVDFSSLWFSFDSYTHSLVAHDPVTRNVSCITIAFLCDSLVTRFSVLSTPTCDRAPLLSLPTEDHTHLFSQKILSQ